MAQGRNPPSIFAVYVLCYNTFAPRHCERQRCNPAFGIRNPRKVDVARMGYYNGGLEPKAEMRRPGSSPWLRFDPPYGWIGLRTVGPVTRVVF